MFRFLCAFVLSLFVAAPAMALDVVSLTESNSLALIGEVNSDSVAKLIDKIQRSDAKELIIYIDSPGGSVVDGLQLIDIMKASGKKYTCVANSAASMAFSILQQCDRRLITPHAIIMQHMGSYGLQGPAPNNLSLSNMAQKLFRELLEMDAARLGVTPEVLYSKTRDDYWLFGKDALKDNAADGVMGVKCDKALAEKKNKEVVSSFFGSFEITMSACPLISTPLEVKPYGQVKGSLEDFVKNVAAYLDSIRPRKFFDDRLLIKK
jgi:ATP-dependent Clp protease protease subunit